MITTEYTEYTEARMITARHYGVFSNPRSREIAGGTVSAPSGLTHRPPSGLADWRSPAAGAETGPPAGNPSEKPAIEDTP